jgi:hypothetical protein
MPTFPSFSPADYEGGVRGPTPASYSPPLVGQQIGSQLAGLPQQYAQGQQLQMATALRNAFPEGLPRSADGTIDSNAILNKVVGITGLGPESLGPLMTLSARQSVAAGDMPPTSGQPATPPPPATARSWLGLGNSPLASNDATGDVDTLRGIGTEVFRGREIGNLLPRYAAALKVADADAPLSPEQQQLARRLMSKSAAVLASQPSQSPVSSDEGVSQRPGSTYSSDYQANGREAANLVTPSSGTSGAPGPSSASGAGPGSAPLMSSGAPAPQGPRAGQPGTQPAEPAAGGGVRMQQPQRMAQAQPGADLVPPQLRHMSPPQAAAWLMARAQRHSEIGDVEGAKLLAQQGQTIQDSIKQSAELTPEQKLARQQGMQPLGYEQAKKQQDVDVTQYSKLYTGISAMGNSAAQSLPQLQAAESIINSPGFYSGMGQGGVLMWKRALAATGINPNAAQNMEGFNKVMSSFVLKQTDDLRAAAIEQGSAGGRIFAQQVDLMVKAAPSGENTAAGNRYLVEIYKRAADRAMTMADKAANYNGGHLDAAFESNMRRWMVDNPMFNKDEMADPRLVAPPVFNNLDEAKVAGIRSGDPVKLPSGKTKWMP